MHRFYTEAAGGAGDVVPLAAEDAAHALRVLRLGPGDAVEAFVSGARWRAVLETAEAGAVTLRLLEPLPSTEPRLRVTLFQGLPKADKMELIVQKAVELGADSVVPVAMSRCVVRLDPRDGERKQTRWQKIAREACKQSGRCLEPGVCAPVPFAEMLRRLPVFDAAVVPWEDAGDVSLTALRRELPDIRTLAVVIGPEGGITPEEVSAMEAAGCRPVTLGPRILRTETAGLCALSAILCLWGEMEAAPRKGDGA